MVVVFFVVIAVYSCYFCHVVGHLHLLLDKMGLDGMGLDKMG